MDPSSAFLRAVVMIAAAIGVLGARAARAHPVLTASAVATVSRDGTLEVSVRHDALAFALGELPQRVDDAQMLALIDGPRADLDRVLGEGLARFRDNLEILVDGARVPASVIAWPTAEKVEAWKAMGGRPLLPVKLEFVARAELGRGTTRFSVRFPERMGEVVLTVQAPAQEPLAALVKGGERSEDYTYNLGAPVIPGTAPAVGRAAPSVGSTRSALGFVLMGFEHIVPEGLDHILFVLGLFFLSPRIKPLLVQVTCFTVAHSVTLALCARGVISLPGTIVEPAIAASIAFVAIENICTQKVHAWRPLVVFAFGLIHGLGFAGAFAEATGAERSPLGPVLLFNAGVELGQLAVVGVALLAVGWFGKRAWYRKGVAIPASVLIACVGVYWTVQRVFF